MALILPLACGLAGWINAATIGAGNVTDNLGPSFFVDDAAAGGTDTTVNQPGTSYTRYLPGLLSANQGPARVTITGFGFATSSSAANNDATSITVTFTYLGADEAVGGSDDVVLGSATGTYSYTAAGEYTFPFDSPLTADLVITGTRFRIQVAPANGAGNGSVVFKTDVLTYETTAGPKFSVSGFVAPQRVNLAKYQQVTTDSVNGQRLGLYVTDGLAGNDNRWESGSSGAHTARVDFPHPVEIGSAQVFSGENDGNALTAFKIQYLSGTSWIDVPGGSITGNTNVERNIVFASPVTASSFRLYDSTDSVVRLRELALYPPYGTSGYPLGTDVTLNLANQRPTTATANTSGNFALLATDGRVNQASKWQTATAGTNSLEIDLRVSTKIGSAQLYSGSSGVAPLADFVLQSWNGSAWQDIPGANITANTSDKRVITFSSTVTTSKVRLQFTNPGTASVRELCIFPANQGNAGYPIGTGVIGAPPVTAKFDDYADSFHLLTNASGGTAAVSAGTPSVNPPSVSLGRQQYQILLNLSNGTYRLHNRATGNCLSGAQLSKTAGAQLIDAPYAAMPDQDWILDKIDITSFFLVNAWSGLLLDTQGGGTSPGTPLVQNTFTGSTTQRWQITLLETFPKKGIAGASNAIDFWAGWTYNWGLQSSASLPAGAFFQPMQWGDFNWGYNTGNASIWKLYPEWRRSDGPLHLLGFNEPDAFSQSGQSLDQNTPQTSADFSAQRSLDQAVTLWPRLQAMDVPLVSPAPANFGGSWLDGFYTQAESLGYRVDYTAVHTYPGPNGGSSDGLINTLTSAYNNWGRPVWLTEFSFVDWNGNSAWSEEDNYNCLAEFLWRAENLPWLRKHSLFIFNAGANNPEPPTTWQDVTPGPRSNARDANGNLTAFGKLYAAWDGDTTVRTNKKYFVHNRDTRKRLASNTGQSTAAARNIRNDTITKWTLVSAPASNRYYLVSVSDGRRLSYTNGGSVILDPPGTMGSAVEWSLTESQHGWFYIGHPATSKRLKMAYNNSTSTATYTMEATSNTTDSVKWRFIVPMPATEWTGASGNDWTNAGNWTPNEVPATGAQVAFNASAQQNLSTQLNQAFSLSGITLGEPAGNVSIGGAQTLALGSSGIDLSAATRNLTVAAPLVLSAPQSWNVASGRTFSANGGFSGAFPLSVEGGGVVSIGAPADPAVPVTIAAGAMLKTSSSSVLSGAAGAVDIVVNGTLDLNGTSQSVIDFDGSGFIENTAAAAATLTVGTNAVAAFGIEPLIQNTGGALALVKTGSRDITFPAGNANTFSGGFTNNGTGWIYPKNNSSFGTGSVVMNGATIYCTDASYTFANTLTLNSAFLRVGSEQSRTIIWTGPLTASGSSGITADSNTGGITLSNTLNIANATFTSSASGSISNNIDDVISGPNGNLVVISGTLQLSGANTYGGSTTLGNSSILRLQPAGKIPNTGNVVINTNSNFNVRNTNAWVHTGSITGDGTGSINLNFGTNATLSGNISGVANININNPGTDATISGVIAGSTNVQVQETVDGTGLGAILRLGGANTYTGTTTILRGTLVLAASNVLPDSTAVILGHATGGATLKATTFTDTAGTLDVLGACTINLGTGAALAFANSSAITWTGGALNITGNFVSGASIRFGISSGGLTATQLALITVNGGGGPYALDASGYLIDTTSGGFASWKYANTATGDLNADHDHDGVPNGIEYFIGGASNTTGFTALPGVADTSGVLSITWTKDSTYQGAYGVHYTVETSSTMSPETWTAASIGSGPDTITISGNNVKYTFPPGTAKFARLRVIGP